MTELLMRAYDVPADQIIGGPNWLREDLPGPSPNTYVVDATMPPGTTKEQFQLMLRNLLAERFHLVVSRETQNYPGYDLVIAKGGSKLKPASSAPTPAATDPNSRPAMAADGFPVLPPGPRTAILPVPGGQRVKYQDRSMAEFVYNLRFRIGLALGQSQWTGNKNPRVRDSTGLGGRYDFVLEFACQGPACTGQRSTGQGLPEPLRANRAVGSDGSHPDGLDGIGGTPEGPPSIFVAVEKQLGLKLVKVKDIPVDVIVVDHVDRIPVEN